MSVVDGVFEVIQIAQAAHIVLWYLCKVNATKLGNKNGIFSNKINFINLLALK